MRSQSSHLDVSLSLICLVIMRGSFHHMTQGGP
jgi:hypothetical protein